MSKAKLILIAFLFIGCMTEEEYNESVKQMDKVCETMRTHPSCVGWNHQRGDR